MWLPHIAFIGIRPGYHYTQRRSWMNDPIPYFDGRVLHVFSVCNPINDTAPWASGGTQAWCHATSKMGTDWQTHQTALPAPRPGTGKIVSLATAARLAHNATAAALTACVTRKDGLKVTWSAELWLSSGALLEWRQVGLLQLPLPQAPDLARISTCGDVHIWHVPRM